MASDRGATHAREGQGVLLLRVETAGARMSRSSIPAGGQPCHCWAAATTPSLSLQWGQRVSTTSSEMGDRGLP